MHTYTVAELRTSLGRLLKQSPGSATERAQALAMRAELLERLTRDQKLKIIWQRTHRDYKGRTNGQRCILILRGGTCLVPLDNLTEAEISDSLSLSWLAS